MFVVVSEGKPLTETLFTTTAAAQRYASALPISSYSVMTTDYYLREHCGWSVGK